jgi:uncharacterized protein
MRVKIEEITERGLDRSETLPADFLNEVLADSNDFALSKSSPLAAHFVKVSGQVHVKGSFDVTVSCPCRRCTTPVPFDLPISFALRMVSPPKAGAEDDESAAADDAKKVGRRSKSKKAKADAQAEREATFDLDEVDAEPFDGKVIDLNPVVREQLLLALPVSVLCREDCKGLCPQCGLDLNSGSCGHRTEKQIDPRLQKLADVKLQN